MRKDRFLFLKKIVENSGYGYLELTISPLPALRGWRWLPAGIRVRQGQLFASLGSEMKLRPIGSWDIKGHLRADDAAFLPELMREIKPVVGIAKFI